MSNKLTHAQHLDFLQKTPHPRIQYGNGLQVPVLQMGGGVSGLEKVGGSDHSVVGVYDPAATSVALNGTTGISVDGEPQEALSRQEIVRQRMSILDGGRPEL